MVLFRVAFQTVADQLDFCRPIGDQALRRQCFSQSIHCSSCVFSARLRTSVCSEVTRIWVLRYFRIADNLVAICKVSPWPSGRIYRGVAFQFPDYPSFGISGTGILLGTDANIEEYGGSNGERSPSNMSDSVHAQFERA